MVNYLLSSFDTSFSYWFVVLFVALGYVYYIVKTKQSFWSKKGIKYVKPTFFIGSMELRRSKSFTEKLVRLYQQFPEERYHGAYQFLQPMLIIKDSELIKLITVKEFDHFPNHRDFGNANSDKFWNKNLFASRDEKWRDLRSTLSPSFTSSKMRIMFSLIEEIAKQFIQFHKQQNEEVLELDMKDTLSRYTNDVIANIAFGLKVDSLKVRNNEFYLMGKEATSFGILAIFKFFINSYCPILSRLLQVKIIPTHIERYFSSIIQDTVKTRKEKNITRPDMIHLLMEAQQGRQDKDEDVKVSEGFSSVSESELTKHRSKQQITNEDINAQAFIFFVAGFETVSTHVVFTFYELAVNPDVQNRLREEINSVEGQISYETLLRLIYLDMVVSESLRKWPPAVITHREVSKDFTIKPTKDGEEPLLLEKGMVCWLPIFAIHRDSKFYAEPEKFDPERFSEENKRKIKPSTYMPFGLGPRNCIGSRFALLESKLILFYVLKNFEIVPVTKTQIPVVLDKKQINLSSAGGLWLGLKSLVK